MKDQVDTTRLRWEPTSLGDVVTLHYGKALAKNERNSTGRVAVYGANGIKDYSDVALVDGPSLIIGRKGSAGEVTRVDAPFWPLDVTYYTSHDANRIDFDFLEYALSMMDLPSLARGVKPGINRNDVYSLSLSLPPLEEQKRIVAVLDQAFAALDRARAHAEANLADAEELFENSLRLTFADLLALWGALPFDEACQTITPTEKIKQRDYLAEGNFPIVAQGAEFVAGYWNDYTAVTETGGPVVIFGDHTRHLKHVDFTFVAGADGTKILKPADGLRSDFFYFALRSQPIEVTGYARHFKFLKEKVVPELPTLDQETLCRSLWEMEGECRRLQENYEDKLTDIADLRQSLLQKAFIGQLTA